MILNPISVIGVLKIGSGELHCLSFPSDEDNDPTRNYISRCYVVFMEFFLIEMYD